MAKSDPLILTTNFCWPPDYTVVRSCYARMSTISTSRLILLIRLFINKMSTDCLFYFVLDVTLRKKDKLQIAETMKKENKKPEPSKDVHLQALKIFINLFPKGTV